MSKPIYEEVIDEIGTQTLARIGLNIFSFSTYNAYGASVTMTNDVFYSLGTNKTKDTKRGDAFEILHTGTQNILYGFKKSENKVYTTDRLYQIKKVQEIDKQIRAGGHSGNNKLPKYYNFIKENYPDEVKNMDFESDEIQNLTMCGNYKGNELQNHESTDCVTINEKNGKIIKKEQLKTTKNTEKEFFRGPNPIKNDDGTKTYIVHDDGSKIHKYIENNDNITVPFDEHKYHRENLEEIINDPKTDPEKKEAAKLALEKLNKSNVNRLMCDNPKTTAILTQSAVASSHIVSVGTSDGVVVALSTLANGTIYEIKDMFSENGEKISITQRLKRLINKVIEAFKSTFKRGAGFGGVDAIVGVLSQIFKSISVKIKYIWKNLRSSAKSIYNAIYDFITGKTKTYRDLVSAIIKALFSFTTIISSIGLESKIEAVLSPIITPMIASFVAPVLAIVVGAFAVVLGTRAIDSAINSLFGVYADLIKSRERRVEIEKVIDEFLPQLVEDNEKLETLIKTKFKDMKLKLDSSFADLQNAIISSNSTLFINSLVQINGVYGQKLKYVNFEEFDQVMLSDNAIKI
ncbi:hypothetical protein O6B72_06290 [Campylobacter ureolyticus]|uniref:hypothetical protein n=1 Tax=Campylobacter ureolyticus TaxID=827 RepID=UPI0022B40AA1|nr:hypothetical protein [Campylobacter ureolyticus]MCZ6156423.1 hypothetical protein [Campylobacter ureolyticus]